MMLKRIIVLFLLLFGWNYHQHAAAQDTSSTLSTKSDTCSVVNMHCGSTPNEGQEQNNRMPGAPGKLGPVGPVGAKGNKGEKGLKGIKGKEAIVNVTDIMNSVAEMLDVANCTQLRERGFTRSGYYLMAHRTTNPVSTYCDFTMHDGRTSCDELRQAGAISNDGHYFVRRNAFSEAKELSCSVSDRSTCHDLFVEGSMRLGKNTLKSTDSQQTFDIFCSFSNGRAITEIWHDEMGQIQNPTDSRCEPAGCYSWSPRYKISPEQILGIITKSSECRQFIKVRCVQVVFMNGNYAWWVSRDGEKMTYWGGATSRRNKYCACGETGTCIQGGKCNCDTNSATEGTDEGYLTDKTKLPVQELRFGDLDDNIEFVWHTLGKLECWGQA